MFCFDDPDRKIMNLFNAGRRFEVDEQKNLSLFDG